MNFKQRRLVVALFVVGALAAWGRSSYVNWKYEVKEAPEPTDLEEILAAASYFGGNLEKEEGWGAENSATEEVLAVVEEVENVVGVVPPRRLNVDMPFYSQAPFADWGMPYQEACEEASILLAANLYNDMKLSKEGFRDELLKIVEWEKKTFGSYEHTTVEQTGQMIRELFGLEAVIHENPSFEDLQRIIARGHLIVAPFAGKKLKNPFYSNGGPNYHMLVIKGYDSEKQQVVTHDVGTRRGENYVFDWSVISGALHDWDDGSIENGRRRILEVWR